MRSLRLGFLALLTLAVFLPASIAQAAFGFRPGAEGFDASLVEAGGSTELRAGVHPYAMKLHLGFRESAGFADGDLRDLHITLPPGMLANPAAIGECDAAAFHTPRPSPYQQSLSGESCPDSTQVGVATVHAGSLTRTFGLFNLQAPYGAPEAVGFAPFGVPVTLAAAIREPDAAFVFGFENLPQTLDLRSVDLTFWGTPWDIAHDDERGNCLNEEDPAAYFGTPGKIIPGNPPTFIAGTCSTGPNPLLEPPKSYLSLPTSCDGPPVWEASASSWQQGAGATAAVAAHDSAGHPLSLTDCIEPLTRGKAQLRTESAAAATGFVFNLDVNDGGGLLNSGGTVRSQIRDASVTLPEGLTINPSLGAGLGVCTEADFAREGLATPPGAGCPNNSKIGDVEVEGLIGLHEPISGSVYLAQPYANPSGTLLALYLTVDSPRRGIFERAAGRIEPDPHDGRLVATFEGLPKLHYSHFELSLREGQRAALISPPQCGAYATAILMTPWSDAGLHVPDSSTLLINHGEGGGPCPTPGAARPFQPGLEAGSLNVQAGAFSPFYLHMTRGDAEQEIASYSATFPPGLLAHLAGIPYCPDAAIEAAKGRSGSEELEHPSCPEASKIGRTLAGYGVGGVLAYAPGNLYLAGPYHGAQVSIVAIDSALVGPFDLGTVVVRSAIRIDKRTAQASIDSSGSDPIPHILKGIPIHLRDIRVYVDRPGFTVNPTSCDPLQTHSTLTGSGADPFRAADDTTAGSSDRFKLLGCSDLGFAPRLALQVHSGSGQAAYPRLHAVYRPRPGNANLAKVQVALPPSVFLAQEHIRKVCTRVRFAAGACPTKSVYGSARALTPLLGEPLEGPVYLRSSNPLPDLVADLHGQGFEVEVVGHISRSRRGGLEATFEDLPDAPVTSFVMNLFGGSRGLLVNSADLCSRTRFASVQYIAHDNATATGRPPLKARCKK